MDANREQLIEAMEEEYDFPGMYPVTFIAKNEDDFEDRLNSALEYEQDGDDYSISQRHSSKKNYASFTVQLFVRSAETALDRKEFLRKLAGVMIIF